MANFPSDLSNSVVDKVELEKFPSRCPADGPEGTTRHMLRVSFQDHPGCCLHVSWYQEDVIPFTGFDLAVMFEALMPALRGQE